LKREAALYYKVNAYGFIASFRIKTVSQPQRAEKKREPQEQLLPAALSFYSLSIA